MAKKKTKFKLKLIYDSPVTVTFALTALILFLLDSFVLKEKLGGTFLLSPTLADGNMPFSFSNPKSYVQLICYVFGYASQVSFLTNMIFLLLIGPRMEELYGSVVIGIMMFVASLFSGVLTASCCKNSIKGTASIVLMLILLEVFMQFSKKKLQVSSILLIVLFVTSEILGKNPNGFIGILITFAGGLCGSLFAFLTSPKARAAKKADKEKKGSASNSFNDEKFDGYDFENLDESAAEISKREKKSIFGKKKSKASKKGSDDDTTVIGTIEL
ncbi:MAG: rhomboid family intramembrane serine protease [Treponema sp.]|nr:rhomboid family intramembrane serine protease [Treponema sp.]